MSSTLGPSIIHDTSLIFELDAADSNSYNGSGTVWNDLSGYNYTGTLVNTPTFNSTNGGSLLFNGTTQQVTFSSSPASSTFSVFAWINIGATNSGYRSVYVSSTGNRGFWINGLKINWYDGADRILGNTTLSTNIWNYVGITYNGTNLTAYLNGASDGTATYAGSSLPAIGYVAGHSGEYFNGNISNIQIYNRVLNSSEIIQNYNTSKARFGL